MPSNFTCSNHFKAEQLREQFTRADNEKKELARKLEEAQGRLEENELARKKLQGKLESLNRQLEEGQGDKERLVEQLESLRGQVRCSLLVKSARVTLKCLCPEGRENTHWIDDLEF